MYDPTELIHDTPLRRQALEQCHLDTPAREKPLPRELFAGWVAILAMALSGPRA